MSRHSSTHPVFNTDSRYSGKLANVVRYHNQTKGTGMTRDHLIVRAHGRPSLGKLCPDLTGMNCGKGIKILDFQPREETLDILEISDHCN